MKVEQLGKNVDEIKVKAIVFSFGKIYDRPLPSRSHSHPRFTCGKVQAMTCDLKSHERRSVMLLGQEKVSLPLTARIFVCDGFWERHNGHLLFTTVNIVYHGKSTIWFTTAFKIKQYWG